MTTRHAPLQPALFWAFAAIALLWVVGFAYELSFAHQWAGSPLFDGDLPPIAKTFFLGDNSALILGLLVALAALVLAYKRKPLARWLWPIALIAKLVSLTIIPRWLVSNLASPLGWAYFPENIMRQFDPIQMATHGAWVLIGVVGMVLLWKAYPQKEAS